MGDGGERKRVEFWAGVIPGTQTDIDMPGRIQQIPGMVRLAKHPPTKDVLPGQIAHDIFGVTLRENGS